MDATYAEASALAELLQRGCQLANVLTQVQPHLPDEVQALVAGELAAYDAAARQVARQLPARVVRPDLPDEPLPPLSSPVDRDARAELLDFLGREGPQTTLQISRALKLSRYRVVRLLREAGCRRIQIRENGAGSVRYEAPAA